MGYVICYAYRYCSHILFTDICDGLIRHQRKTTLIFYCSQEDSLLKSFRFYNQDEISSTLLCPHIFEIYFSIQVDHNFFYRLSLKHSTWKNYGTQPQRLFKNYWVRVIYKVLIDTQLLSWWRYRVLAKMLLKKRLR